ncbi:MAG: T9SS type A sorting domain-containing protein [Bacteroidia bacterium]
MKNRVVFIAMFLGFGGGVLGQNPLVKQWDKRFGGTNTDWLYAFEQTADGGYILGGPSFSDSSGDKSQNNQDTLCNPNCESDFWIVKIDSMGLKQWDKRFGGIEEDRLNSFKQTIDGGYILGGSSRSGVSGDKTQPNWDISQVSFDYWVVKIDSVGNKQWDRRYGGFGYDHLNSLAQTNDGGYLLGGNSTSDISGDKTQNSQDTTSYLAGDYWIVKIDSSGNKQWDKRFGGKAAEHLASMEKTIDGGYILGGYSFSGAGGDKTQPSWGSFDYWVVKIDSIGVKQWDRRFGGTSADYLNTIHQTIDGGYILGGISWSGVNGDKTQPVWGGYDFWIVKINSFGNKIWDKDFGGTNWENERGNVMQTKDQGYLIAGTSNSGISGDKSENNLGIEQPWIVKADSLGNKQWDKTIFTTGEDDGAYALQTNYGSYVIASFTDAGIGGYKTEPNWDPTNQALDFWIIKFNDTTSFIPSTNLSSSDTSFCEKHCIDFYDLSTNNPTSWQWFFPGADSLTSTLQNPTNICYNSYGSYDVTLIACNAAGCDTLHLTNFITCYQNPTDSIYQSNDTLFSLPAYSYQWYEVTNGIIAGATNQYFVPQQAGSYYCVITDSIGCAGSSGTIVITGVNEWTIDNGQLTIIPNPFSGNITITFQKQNINKISFTIKNALGQIVFNASENNPMPNYTKTVDLSLLTKGIYFLDVIIDGAHNVRKIVKE